MNVDLARRTATAIVLLGISVAAVVVVASPASAVPGLTAILAQSANDSTTAKSVVAQCPAGTTVIGGGGSVHGNGEVFLTGLRPVVSPFGTGYQAFATEDDTGYLADWQVSAYAICAPRPRGLEYRWSTSQRSSQASQGVSATCTAGKKVLGTGAVINNGGQHVGLSHALATTDTHVAAVAHEDETGYSGTWSVTAWAVCADPLPSYERVVSAQTSPSDPSTAIALCPFGTTAHGAGGYVAGGWGEVWLVSVMPWGVTALADETGYAGTWTPVAEVLCAA